MQTIAGIRSILNQCEFNDWQFDLWEEGATDDDLGRPVLRVRFYAPCNEARDGVTQMQTGRKWFLSRHMTKSEIVQTAFKAVLTAVEHEVREQFRYRSLPIFGPHFDVDQLVDLCQRPDALDERDAA